MGQASEGSGPGGGERDSDRYGEQGLPHLTPPGVRGVRAGTPGLLSSPHSTPLARRWTDEGASSLASGDTVCAHLALADEVPP